MHICSYTTNPVTLMFEHVNHKLPAVGRRKAYDGVSLTLRPQAAPLQYHQYKYCSALGPLC